VAREAVRKSLVLLKDDRHILPLNARAHILVAGDADSIMKQTGGWTLSWQGNDNDNADFPGATSIWSGVEQAVKAGGGTAQLSRDGSFTTRPAAAIVVFGESPYAEFQGDQADVALHSGNGESLALLHKLRSAGIPTVAVLLSGRPLYLNAHINAADAFVAAWLPGSEGAGIADVLIGDRSGKVRHDFQGRLSFSWPRRPDQTPLNVGDKDYDPQFAVGYGLSYTNRPEVGTLVEAAVEANSGERGEFFAHGKAVNGFALSIGDAQAPRIAAVGNRVATYGKEALVLTTVDRRAQEDSRLARWSGAGDAWVELAAEKPVDLSREANGAMVLAIDLRVDQAPQGPMTIELAGGGRSAGLPFVPGAGAPEWWTVRIPLRCFAAADLGAVSSILRIRSAAPAAIAFSDVRLVETKAEDRCP
jgi:beta-glucosidase